PTPADGAPADLTKPPTPEATEPDTDDDQDDEQTTPRTRKLWALLKADHEARAVTTPPKSQKARARARRTVYAATAYGMGWTLHLPAAITSLLEVSADYAIPVSGGVLAAGIVGLATHTRGGGAVFLSSLGLVTVMTLVPPAYFIGGALTLASLLAYRVVRGWLGQYAATWPWTGVAWAAFIPTASTAVTTLLHGTN
ncbi:hypothetical protein G3I42_08445, partial [Streptomyces sp. SID11385]|nr:hypothetical protein [Streptomyces sp. SID11385]